MALIGMIMGLSCLMPNDPKMSVQAHSDTLNGAAVAQEHVDGPIFCGDIPANRHGHGPSILHIATINLRTSSLNPLTI